LYQYGAFIKGIELHFENGLITKALAAENEQMLLDMIAVENANKIGEFSLTDRRTSRITKFMAETLYDENV
jgi:aminopeptidase